MSDLQQYFNVIMLLFPVLSAAACLILMGFSCRDCLILHEKKLKGIVMFYLTMTGLSWLTTFFYFFAAKVFVFTNVFCLAAYLLVPVLFYRTIRFLTRFGQPEHFSWFHYLFPALISSTLLVWSLFVPFDAQTALVESRQTTLPTGEYEAFSRFSTSKPLLRIVYATLYFLLVVRTLVRYFRRVNDSDSRDKCKPAPWVLFILILMGAIVLSSLVALIIPRDRILSSLGLGITSICLLLQHILMTYHVIRRKYLLYVVCPPKRNTAMNDLFDKIIRKDNAGRRMYSGAITCHSLEACFREHKPYLNPRFKITDLVELIDVNRTAISSFINRQYGMNFNKYLNHWRLEELKQLQAQPENKARSVLELCVKAGFSEAQQYNRATKQVKLWTE